MCFIGISVVNVTLASVNFLVTALAKMLWILSEVSVFVINFNL